jgi:hypothetical protein
MCEGLVLGGISAMMEILNLLSKLNRSSRD